MSDDKYFVMKWETMEYSPEPMWWLNTAAYETWPEDCIGKDLTLEEAEALAAILNNNRNTNLEK